jgi:cell division protein FtsX
VAAVADVEAAKAVLPLPAALVVTATATALTEQVQQQLAELPVAALAA